jgi:hypothetical protein
MLIPPPITNGFHIIGSSSDSWYSNLISQHKDSMFLQFYITFITIILEREEHIVSREAMQNHDMDATLLSMSWVMWKNDTLGIFHSQTFLLRFSKKLFYS